MLKSLQQSNLLSVQLPLLAMASWLRETQKASTRSVVSERRRKRRSFMGERPFIFRCVGVGIAVLSGHGCKLLEY